MDSKKGEGSVFTIYLPATTEKVKKEEVELPEEILIGTETILFVDDEEVILEVVKDMLEEMGYTVLSANRGKDAIKVF